MITESKYFEMKSRIPEVKGLFQTRHYIQCTNLCERLLTRSDEEIHPIHRAYLNFYLALSHDTMARETSSRNRLPELDLAEKYYVAALAALSPARPQKLENIQESLSPTFSHSEDESVNSEHSSSTVATSILDDSDSSDFEPTPRTSNYHVRSRLSRGNLDDFPASKLGRKRPGLIITSPTQSSSVQSRHEKQYTTVFSSFAKMVETHLSSVRNLRDAPVPQSNRFSGSRSRGSSFNSRPASRDIIPDDAAMEKIRWGRKSMSFRPRFDPESVQALCRDALSEL
ncbi:uncharacterized protein BDR25DRAFT_381657 [Lindgomyces ingoldianus]|uniref:Uncharacterized protein n=1 Tax=Lindgomyces ingoldianus TaxID=673940 RepID=A0ACB6QAR8_9PLEO|nr:uncharacterized protein BDR25DRAFT_381657 [Lindgomyces ingoldianus]KAF2464038.1 hypothetical protein BDR25DRAFT_381657 [Lindgomyces ingoldianus]